MTAQAAQTFMTGDAATTIRSALRAVDLASRHGVYSGTCLSRSLLLWWLLLRCGLESELRFGAQVTDGKLDAHAWVEFAGQPLNEDESVRWRYAGFNPP
jgi:hypothetical protein